MNVIKCRNQEEKENGKKYVYVESVNNCVIMWINHTSLYLHYSSYKLSLVYILFTYRLSLVNLLFLIVGLIFYYDMYVMKY